MPTANHVLLQRITLTDSTTTAVIFDNIPQTGYTDLKLTVSGRFSSGAGFNLINFNGLSTANFSHKVLEGTGASAISFVQGSTNYAGPLNGSSDTANTFSNQEIYIFNYTSSNFKSISFDGVMENNGTTAYMDLGAMLWSNTAAITSVRLQTHTGAAYAAGSSFSLYGIANAATTPAAAPKADGGDIIKTDGTYWYHAFTGSGIFKPQVNLTCDYLVVAGGGGGGATESGNGGAGGGGAGGFRTGTGFSVSSNTSYPITVGAGGLGSTSRVASGTSGSNSTFSTITSTGGGFGASAGAALAASGGSGGGGTMDFRPGGAGNTPSTSPSQGNNGGTMAPNYPYVGAGGGGASATGGTGGSTGGTGTGGAGTASSITGTSITYAGGGGGGAGNNGSGASNGGAGGGGNGGSGTGTAGTAALGGGGGGGGGGSGASPGGNGGSGVVIIKYPV